MSTMESHDGWDLHTSGPVGADHTVLLLPGGMCTAAFFDDLVKEPELSRASTLCGRHAAGIRGHPGS